MGKYRNRACRNPLDRFIEKINIIPESDCLIWVGSTFRYGYGQFWIKDNKTISAHRWIWEFTNDSIPEGMVIDHICRNARCVNPSHLRVTTQQINTTENSESPLAKNAAKTHCIRGHAFDEENTIRTKKGRQCRICRKMHDDNNHWLNRTERLACMRERRKIRKLMGEV